MDNSTKEVEIEVKRKREKYTVGKAIFNQKKFQELFKKRRHIGDGNRI